MAASQTDDQNVFSNFENGNLKAKAKVLLKGKWNKCALLGLIFICISGGISSIPQIGGLLSFIITGPLTLGLASIFLKISNNQDFNFEELFSGFNDFIRTFLAYLILVIFIILWTLLLIVPGIIAAISYSLTFYILAEDPNISANDARKKSKELMMGHKGELFGIGLSFIGWALLCIPTLGIGFLWLFPYINTTMALFYKKVKNSKA